MLNAEDKQFKLNDSGAILFQIDKTNPMPGKMVIANIRKGVALLAPSLDLVAENMPEKSDAAAVEEKLQGWLARHIADVLAPLMLLVNEEGIESPAKDIAVRLHEALGIVPRADLEALIAGLDETGRAALRQRKVRMGPVLVFVPALNKPAAVHMRALLWSLWHDKTLPAPVPADGITSLSLAETLEDLAKNKDIDPLFYRAVGYPVYGKRAIRVDMLDRLIGAVYDRADKGVFKARHDMAEWMGCPIVDLYDILEAMGHKKIHDPADKKPVEEAETSKIPEADSKVEVKGQPKEETKSDGESKKESLPEKDMIKEPENVVVAEPEKPELATFRLRRGKAYGEAKPRHKPYKKKEEGGKKGVSSDKPRSSFKGKKKPYKKDKPREPKQRVYTAAAPQSNPDDSPFAILQQLKGEGK